MRKIDNTEVLKRLGENIRSIRKSKGFTLEYASAHSGIDTSDIGKIERGEINVAFTTLYKLSFGLEVEIIDLVNFEI